MEKINRTPYALEATVVLDRKGREALLVIVKGTFDFAPGASRVAEEPGAVVFADEYRDDPASSSIRVATDMLPPRPQTGVTLEGHAVCPDGQTGKMNVGLKLGSLQQVAVVYGNRVGFQNVDKPEPFERMPLTWENAFGGWDRSHDKEKHHAGVDENPVGKGFLAGKSQLSPREVALPNIEHPSQSLRAAFESVPSVGFGPVAPAWLPRRNHAGTYDETWQRERSPLLPDDFDDRFLQAAPGALTADGYLDGNENCVLLGMTEEGRIEFPLVAEAPTVGVRLHGAGIRSQPKLESIHIDADARQYAVTWKSMVNIQGRLEALLNVEARIL